MPELEIGPFEDQGPTTGRNREGNDPKATFAQDQHFAPAAVVRHFGIETEEGVLARLHVQRKFDTSGVAACWQNPDRRSFLPYATRIRSFSVGPIRHPAAASSLLV